jgi:hypothetical protein
MEKAQEETKTLYFLAPRFGRWKIEQKIVNELDAPCYTVVNKYHKHFGNDDICVVMKKKFIMVRCNESLVNKVNKVLG